MSLPTFLALVAPLAQGVPASGEPPARALSRELCATPRLASTAPSRRAARWLAGELLEAGWSVRLDRRVVVLSLPRRIEVAGFAAEDEVATLFERVDTFDPDADPPGDVPKFNSWTKSASVFAPVVDVGRGLREDYLGLLEAGVELEGRIALARYGGSYRGVKAELAEEHGCVGVLLFSDPASDGAERGPTWPDGPWKPGWDAQRGSISRLAKALGDPSTPGWPSPSVAGVPASGPWAGRERLLGEALEAELPGIPCTPIGADEARPLVERCASGGTPWARIAVDAPRELRPIVNVVARLDGTGEDFVVAGNHRDTWVRGAHDAGSGTVALLRAAQRLGERRRSGWSPPSGIVLGFWDAEEHGLIGSTEWGEEHARELLEHAIAYVNADAAVSGTRLRASGTPGLLGTLRDVLADVPAPRAAGDDGEQANAPASLWEQWRARFEDGEPHLGLPGSGSDFTVFLHHIGLPVLDIGFSGNRGGQYHASFDDFEHMDRHLDPTWEGHETAGRMLARLLATLAERGRPAFDEAEAAAAMARMVRKAGAEERDGEAWLGVERAGRLAAAFETLGHAAQAAAGQRVHPPFYAALASADGLVGRTWFKNRLWAPGLETGYAAETLPSLRRAARDGEAALDAELADLIDAVRALGAQREAAALRAAPAAAQPGR